MYINHLSLSLSLSLSLFIFLSLFPRLPLCTHVHVYIHVHITIYLSIYHLTIFLSLLSIPLPISFLAPSSSFFSFSPSLIFSTSLNLHTPVVVGFSRVQRSWYSVWYDHVPLPRNENLSVEWSGKDTHSQGQAEESRGSVHALQLDLLSVGLFRFL